uniref:hydroxyacylglutathione hydrolase n=1 Tax=Heterosigma akashiwo TaxID=2829 RepID=A0A6V1NKM9_HETAK|mmetsp:Transcript_3791/g.6079  ORF Transcript_3791/g.6079 Transcript_3791/m.6079 type:complete len:255 (+) Transcript_3791:56-820(+)|eukprot:CAMPEP_0194569830 /NCGR_PEP_ID=MMETSP0292-20121207/7392_1 /TAXON_ID=39354 /ORGANISM="Heterosigma akashiwo, Strain CCMP2393" /LENGTH=254 /DNA_ID=CAMNT_0039420165 /DNA_START=53 /DNA_END=817 /DNA_ORIENTATION=+
MKVVPVPTLSDNYAYLLIDELTNTAAAVDPAEPEKVLRAALDQGVSITTVLATHKHWDHSGGNAAMKTSIPDVEIIGGATEGVEACTKAVEDGEQFMLGENVTIRCIHTPGHTMGHTCYYAVDGDSKAVFTGDTLFIGGCGRFFEGTARDMHPSLCLKLGALPPDTAVYCGHEYTLANYRFALSVDPENAALREAQATAQATIDNGGYTVPSTIGKELATNPFMRPDASNLQEKTETQNPIECLAAIRAMKDRF